MRVFAAACGLWLFGCEQSVELQRRADAALDARAEAGADAALADSPSAPLDPVTDASLRVYDGPRESRCDQLDDDGDGMVDEGWAYARQTEVFTHAEGRAADLWGFGASDSRIAIAWELGTMGADTRTLTHQYDFAGNLLAIGSVSLGRGPQRQVGVHWAQGAFWVLGTARPSTCPTAGGSQCATSVQRLSTDGSAQPIAPIVRGWETSHSIESEGQILSLYQASAERAVRLLRIIPGASDAEVRDEVVLGLQVDERIGVAVPVRVGERIAWMFNSSQAGLSMLVTDRAGRMLSVHRGLVGGALFADPSTRPATALGDDVVAAFLQPTGLAIGRWSLDGTSRMTPVALPGDALLTGLVGVGGQVEVVYASHLHHFLWRIAPDGTVTDPGHPIEDGYGLGMIPSAEGVWLFFGDYYLGHTTWFRYGCPTGGA